MYGEEFDEVYNLASSILLFEQQIKLEFYENTTHGDIYIIDKIKLDLEIQKVKSKLKQVINRRRYGNSVNLNGQVRELLLLLEPNNLNQ